MGFSCPQSSPGMCAQDTQEVLLNSQSGRLAPGTPSAGTQHRARLDLHGEQGAAGQPLAPHLAIRYMHTQALCLWSWAPRL